MPGLLYEIVQIPNFITKPMGLMFRRNYKHVKDFKYIAVERQSYIGELLQTPQFDAKCSDHLFPLQRDVTTNFTVLDLNALSGVFGFYMILIACSVCGLLVEVLWQRQMGACGLC
jgi:hypothetical protein